MPVDRVGFEDPVRNWFHVRPGVTSHRVSLLLCVCVWSGRSVVGNGGPSATEMNNGIDGRGFLDVCTCASSNIKAELHGHGVFFVSALVVDVSRKMVISAQRTWRVNWLTGR